MYQWQFLFNARIQLPASNRQAQGTAPALLIDSDRDEPGV
jgi:hypothetical protein